jgi:hypothetical protein
MTPGPYNKMNSNSIPLNQIIEIEHMNSKGFQGYFDEVGANTIKEKPNSG